jgi:L-histidine N-alpha-methyltransferase
VATDLTVHLAPSSYRASLRADVRAGLTAEPKSLPPKYFYDQYGSELFDEITRLPEYYPTRAETAILRTRAGEIARIARPRTVV